MRVPVVNNKFVCIVDRHSAPLAAIVSSYLAADGKYVPFFEMPPVTLSRSHILEGRPDERTYSQYRADRAWVLIAKALAVLKECEYIILVGLSTAQKSYLHLPEGVQIIEIGEPGHVDFFLSHLADPDKPFFLCHPNELLKGLQLAVEAGCRLQLDNYADTLPRSEGNAAGCIVIENDGSAMAVIAVIYALSVQAHIIIVSPLAENEDKNIRYWLADWKNNHDRASHEKILFQITSRIGEYDLFRYEYVTFFTGGIPYTLVVGQQTSCTYVHLQHAPDHFVFNNIFYANIPGAGAALLFSPEAFAADGHREEMSDVVAVLQKMHFHIQALIGKEATVYNIAQYLVHFPADLVHICSHGGEIKGIRVRSEFIDSNGQVQSIEYDLVRSYKLTPLEENGASVFLLENMAFPRIYNGYEVGKDDLQIQQYPPSFFIECQNAVAREETIKDEWVRDIEYVTDSRHIECYGEQPFLAVFTSLAGGMKPIIFNNTCWSWSPVSASFLENGVRGYIGTLWGVNNNAAVDTAIAFYDRIKSIPVAQAIWEAAHSNQPAGDEDIYVFYGLHFTRLLASDSEEDAKKRVTWMLNRWKAYYKLMCDQISDKHRLEYLDLIDSWHDEVIKKMMC